MMLFCLISFFYNFLAVFFGNKFRSFNYKYSIIFGFPYSDLGFHISMYRTKRNTVVMLSVGWKPTDFSSDIFMAEVTFRADNLTVFQSLLLTRKLSGYIFHIVMKHHVYFLFPIPWKYKCIYRIIFQSSFIKTG